MKKYFGIVLLRTENLNNKEKSYEETYLSIDSISKENAIAILEKYAKSCETTYANKQGDLIAVKYEQIIDINEYLREEPDGNCLEIYSRHFDDIEVYSKFEKLYKC